MFSLERIRENFYSQWSWWLLLLTFALTFFVSDRSDAKNFYRVLVALPVLLMLSGPVLKDVFASKPMRWFAAVSVYFLATLLWSAEFRSLDNYLLRVLSVWTFAFLLYYLAQFRPELFLQIDKVLVVFGLIWIALIVSEWDNLWQANLTFNQSSVSRGVFSHHLQVGWMVAVLTLISLQRIFRENSKQFFWVVITVTFLIVLILVQARGGLLVFFVGLVTCLFSHSRRLSWRFVLVAGAGLLSAVGVVFLLSPEIFSSLMARGTAFRFVIWENWFSVWQASSLKMFFGYGLGAPAENLVSNFTAAHFHNFFLNTIYYGGLVGFALTIGWFFSLVKLVYEEQKFDSPWIPVVVGMLGGFLTDGDKLFNYPGAFTFCFLLPTFCLSFNASHLQVRKYEEIPPD